MPLTTEWGLYVNAGTPPCQPLPSVTMASMRRSRGLADIAPQYIAKSGLCTASEMETSRGGSIRIQHLTSSPTAVEGRSRFPKLDECAHFHYEHVELNSLQVSLCEEEDLKPLLSEPEEGKWWSVSVTSQSETWLIRRSYENFRMLDQQLHRCIYDRKFSGLKELPTEIIEEQENIHELLSEYLKKFSSIAGCLINCGPVLNWLEMDNRGHRLLVPDTDNCPINTPAVAAAYAIKRYTAQAPDEISFEVGDMISVIDMPPPEESIWWRGKRGFQVGFFPCECVAVIGDKVPRNLHFSTKPAQPTKPVLRKHGKLIAFFRSFILSRPSRRRLKQSGILKERVFGCDLGEHLLNSGHEIPMVLKCCAEFIETNGIVDGIYRLSGVTSNIQKLRNAFDEDRVPDLYEDEAILQDIHSVASLLKMYFRELPNPLCTYQLYHQFVTAVQTNEAEDNRLLRMRDVVQKLPPPHYRTLEYLMRHLARVAEKGSDTGMTARNVAIVWAPNLLRCKELEIGGVAALQGVGVQAVVTEFLICYSELIFCDRLPHINLPPLQATPKKCRPKSLAISTPTKLLSLEEARTRALSQSAGKHDQDYIEVGGGPASLPAKYHTVIELPRKRNGSKRSPLGWKSIFSKSARGSHSRKETPRKSSTPSDLGLNVEKAITESDLAQNKRRLRPAKSVESLNSGGTNRNSVTIDVSEIAGGLSSPEDTLSPMPLRNLEIKGNGHNRSVSHDSYFDQLTENQDDERFESNLDLSEIQVNFDLEESEMRIFSEDETLMSVGSGSLASHSSPRILLGHKYHKSALGHKRISHPKLAKGEDSLSSSQSVDPSPKKLKTNDIDDVMIVKRSRLEEQLTSSAGDLQFIDSVSPEQVTVQAEVHPIQSPSPVSSISLISSFHTSPILPHIPHLRPLSQQLDKNTQDKNTQRPKSQPFIVDMIMRTPPVMTATLQSTEPCITHHSKSVDYNCSSESQSIKSKLFQSFDIKSQSVGSKESSPVSSRFRQLNSSEISPTSHITSPSLAEATVSDNESLSLHSSGLTTPDTPLQGTYSPLLDTEESSVSNNTTPDNEGLEKIKKNSSEMENLDKKMSKINVEFGRDKNIGQEYDKFEKNILKMSCDIPVDVSFSKAVKAFAKYENITPEMLKELDSVEITSSTNQESDLPVPHERREKPCNAYENVPPPKDSNSEQLLSNNSPNLNKRNLENSSNILLETSFDSKILPISEVKSDDFDEVTHRTTRSMSPTKRDSQISIKYVNISTESSCDSLINFNKADECHRLLLTTKEESRNFSPVLDNNKMDDWPIEKIEEDVPTENEESHYGSFDEKEPETSNFSEMNNFTNKGKSEELRFEEYEKYEFDFPEESPKPKENIFNIDQTYLVESEIFGEEPLNLSKPDHTNIGEQQGSEEIEACASLIDLFEGISYEDSIQNRDENENESFNEVTTGDVIELENSVAFPENSLKFENPDYSSANFFQFENPDDSNEIYLKGEYPDDSNEVCLKGENPNDSNEICLKDENSDDSNENGFKLNNPVDTIDVLETLDIEMATNNSCSDIPVEDEKNMTETAHEFRRSQLPLLETSFEYIEKEESGIENAIINLVKSPKRTNITSLGNIEKNVNSIEDENRERKLSNEHIAATSPQRSNSSGNVRQLLSKFEFSPTSESSSTDLNSEYLGKVHVSPCLKAKNTRLAKKQLEEFYYAGNTANSDYKYERPKTLERMSTKRRTDKQKEKADDFLSLNLEKSKSGSQIDSLNQGASQKHDFTSEYDIGIDLSDPQRRERIEKYKEKRRNYLREKYRTDNFKDDKEELLPRLKPKQKDEIFEFELGSRKAPFDKPARKNLPLKDISPQETSIEDVLKKTPPVKPERKFVTDKKINLERKSTDKHVGKIHNSKVIEKLKSPERTPPTSPSRRDIYKKSVSVDTSSVRFRFETPTTSSLARESNTSSKIMSHKSNFERKNSNSSLKSPLQSPSKSLEMTLSSSQDHKISDANRGSYRRKFSAEKTRSSTDSGIGVSSDSSRTSLDSKSSLEHSRSSMDGKNSIVDDSKKCNDIPSPSYCIKDMTALFENRETSSGPHKQYLSSV